MADQRYTAPHLALLARARYRMDPAVRAAIRHHVMEYTTTHPTIARRGRPIRRWVWAAVLFSVGAAAGPMILARRSVPTVRGPGPSPAAHPASPRSSPVVDPAIRLALEPLNLPGVPRMAPRGVRTAGLSVDARTLPGHTGYVLDVGPVSLVAQQHPTTVAALAALAQYHTVLQQALIKVGTPATTVVPGTTGTWFAASTAGSAASSSVALVWQEGTVWIAVRGPTTEHAGIVSAARVLAQEAQRAPFTHTGLAVLSVTLWPTTPAHPAARFGWTAAWIRDRTELVVTATGSTRATGTSLSLGGLWTWVRSVSPLPTRHGTGGA